MTINEVKRFTDDVEKSHQIVKGLEECGTDAKKIAALAKILGYNVTEQDLNEFQSNLSILGNKETLHNNVRGTILITIG